MRSFIASRIVVCMIIAVMGLTLLTSCTERQRKNIKHIKSDLVGLKRRVTLYDCNGKVIREWIGRFKIEEHGSFVSFIDDNGNDIKVSGTVIIEEI